MPDKELPWDSNFIIPTCMFSMVRFFSKFTSVQASACLGSLSAACRILTPWLIISARWINLMLHPVICSQEAKWFSAKSMEKYCKFTANNKIV